MKPDQPDQKELRLESAIVYGRQMDVPEPPESSQFLALHPTPRIEIQDGGAVSQGWLSAFRQPGRTHVVTLSTIVIAVAISCFYSGTFAPNVLARVIETVTQHQLVKFRIHQTGEIKPELSKFYRGNANNHYIVYADLQKPRLRLESPSAKTLNDIAEQSSEEILDYAADRYLQIYRFDLVLFEKDTTDERQLHFIREIQDRKPDDNTLPGPHQRTARLFRVPRPDPAKNELHKKPYSDMGKDRSFLDTLRTLQISADTVSADDVLDGLNTTQYRLTEGDWTSIVWIDPISSLPVRIEHEVSHVAGSETLATMKWVYTDFAWDPNVENIDALFSTEPPDGYKFEDRTTDF
jgi:hypothetical protein